MTYSDVITLLMTFFILLLTFATTEPERFEKSTSTVSANGAATGTAGKKLEGIDKDSWVNRLRPPASRIAMRGAEMPPISTDPARKTFGEGLRSLNEEEAQQNDQTSHSFVMPYAQAFDSEGKLSAQGRLVCQMLSGQLRELPFQAAIEFSDVEHVEAVTGLMEFLFDVEKTRPGQVSMNLLQPSHVAATDIRFTVKRFMQEP